MVQEVWSGEMDTNEPRDATLSSLLIRMRAGRPAQGGFHIGVVGVKEVDADVLTSVSNLA